MTETVLPEGTSGSALLRIQSSSRLAFGATTAALVTLASGGTAVLVSHGTSSMAGPTSLPAGALLPESAAAPAVVMVERAPGTWAATPPLDPTVKALRDALAERPEPGRRTLVVPLVDLGGRPDLAPVAGPVLAPTVPLPELPGLLPVPGDLPGVEPVPGDLPGVVPEVDRPEPVRGRPDTSPGGKDGRPGPVRVPATPATPAVPGDIGSPAVPAVPAVPARPDTPAKADKADREDREEKADREDREDREEKADRDDKAEKAERAEKASKAGKGEGRRERSPRGRHSR